MRALIAILIFVLLGAAAYAAETITYTYDARGRLKQVAHSGSVNNNVVTNYVYDKADNRTNKTTTGSPNPPPP
jgi:Tfp pilus assembly protein PilV